MKREEELRLLNLIIAPVISEKSTRLADEENTYVFKVKREATKPEIRRAIELAFNVEVEKVRTLNVKGKVRGLGLRKGKRPDGKKAYVKLKPGHEIDLSVGE